MSKARHACGAAGGVPMDAEGPVVFVLVGDPHVEAGRGDAAYGAHEEQLVADFQAISAAEPQARCIVVLGDLTENGATAELSAYARAAASSPLPVLSVFGGHDGLEGHRLGAVDPTASYRAAVGPLWYARDLGSLRCIALVAEARFLNAEQQAAQACWLEQELGALARERDLVVFQHLPATAELLARLAGYGLRAVGYAHYHCTRVHRRDEILMMAAPGLSRAGFDGDPRGYLRFEASRSGVCCRKVMLGERRASAQGRGTQGTGPCPRPQPPSVDTSPGTALSVCWRRSLDVTLLYNAPNAVARRLYLATPDASCEAGALHCLNATDGSPIWRCALPAVAPHTPVLAGERVCVQTGDGGLHCVDARDGAILWHAPIDTGADRWAGHAPTVCGDLVFCRTASRPPVATDGRQRATVAAIRLEDGQVVWEIPFDHTDWMCPHGAPLCAAGKVFVPAVLGNGVSCFAQDTGHGIWDKAGDGALARVAGSPAYSSRHHLIVVAGYWWHPVPMEGERRGSLCALDADTGATIWCVPVHERTHTTPVVVDDRVLLAEPGRGHLSAFDVRTGARLWRFATGAALVCTAPGQRDTPSLTATPIVAGDIAFFGAGDGCVYAVDLVSGAEVARCALGEAVAASAALVGDMLFVSTCAGSVYCLRVALD